ncbi:Uncharacterised protein [Sphingobacterium spiritivorum]|uniref:Uncharacterized protein n=1 Tax=Sphingobacterium spiritivorum TaxID=258 RepID=A0A380CGT5_SPHSI|nr:hypothetical protein [Sphingobacterium spiritivorum]SUJ19153.1 Uncharacterised protein [Sphingobacterium spiritivorum]
MNIQRSTYNAGIPVFQHDKSLQLLTGGFVLNVSGYANGAVIGAGTAILVDEINRTALAVKTAITTKAIASANTEIEVAKGHLLTVGDQLNGKAISAIDTSDPAFDKITLAAGYGAAVAINTAIGTGDGNALLYNPVKVVTGNVHSVDAVVGGLVYARRIGYISAATKANLPNIIFSQTK